MNATEIQCASILTRAGGYLKSVCSHSLNPYIGCGFGKTACGVGCYVRFNPWLTGGREWGEFVDVKINAPEIYLKTAAREKRWANRRGQPFAVFLSSSTEPWQPLEKRYRLTRRLLEAMLVRLPDELIVQTHSPRMKEDLPLIARLSQQCRLRVHVSLEGDRDRLPGLPPPPASVAERIHLLRETAEAGVTTVACLAPLYPLKNPPAFFDELARAGVHAVVIDHFIQGDGTAEGTRTLKTELPLSMERVDSESIRLEYRDRIAAIARRYLPVGLSASGFAGHYSQA
ncbi:MAG: hypothetical protein GWM98_27800 [Nitrospinaceae bacterium]|nr:hypothetical protein [Nitrospinaceae bacterium]NIR57565.1 hypothetical protein [Nitrospinaceae bacterium]NIS88035.1 hypothetical protein [Nitrospinaceae bacterium]NIT84899.1 hypothetical protein [Nitrospinaceae bacterium]NIU47075.1 hypothetical protein [Nitrospinaceae bacterium]